jgi:rhodanese-related sulfurtransferase
MDVFKPENLKKLPKDKRIVVICYVGHTASQVMMGLRLLGYKASGLKFGMGVSPSKGVPVAGWTDFGFEIIKGKN